MKVFKKTKQILVTAFLVALVSFGAYTFMVFYIYSLNTELSPLRDEIISEQNRGVQLKSTEEALKKTLGAREKIDEFFVGEGKEADFISSVESLAGALSREFEVNAFALEPSEFGDDVEYVRIQATARGSFSEMKRLIAVLEHLPEGGVLGNVSLNAVPSEKKGAPDWKMSFVLKALKVK